MDDFARYGTHGHNANNCRFAGGGLSDVDTLRRDNRSVFRQNYENNKHTIARLAHRYRVTGSLSEMPACGRGSLPYAIYEMKKKRDYLVVFLPKYITGTIFCNGG